MKGRLLVVNTLILGGIVLLAMHHIRAWEGFQSENNLERLIAGVDHRESAAAESFQSGAEGQPFSDFMVISEKNLFAEDRQPEAVAEEEESRPVEIAPPKWANRPILHGVSQMGGRPSAIVTVFEAGQKGQMKTVTEGHLIQGYRVSEIGDSSMRLLWRDLVEVIEMGGDAPAAQGDAATRAVQTSAVTVVKVGSALPAVSTSGTVESKEETALEVAVVSGQQGASQPGSNQARQALPNQRNPGGAVSPVAAGTNQGLTSQALRARRSTQGLQTR